MFQDQQDSVWMRLEKLQSSRAPTVQMIVVGYDKNEYDKVPVKRAIMPTWTKNKNLYVMEHSCDFLRKKNVKK